MNDALILVVEDEDKISTVICEYLQAAGARTHQIANGLEVLPWLRKNSPSLVLLDLMLPGCDGLTVCRELRKESSVPVIMITARREEQDRLTGFELGVDDYICKPFSAKEVVARVVALLRRAQGEVKSPKSDSLILDRNTYRVSAKGKTVSLTALEFEMLHVLMGAPGRIFSRDEIMNRVYNDFRIVNDRTIDSHVKKLRRKLDSLQLDEKPLRSVYGVGYKYEM
jgi:two-component system response regulator BaeR